MARLEVGRTWVSMPIMTQIKREILATLETLTTAVRTGDTAAPGPSLLSLFAELDRLDAQLPLPAEAELHHFLQRKSYEKARLLLMGRGSDNAPGTCGR